MRVKLINGVPSEVEISLSEVRKILAERLEQEIESDTGVYASILPEKVDLVHDSADAYDTDRQEFMFTIPVVQPDPEKSVSYKELDV